MGIGQSCVKCKYQVRTYSYRYQVLNTRYGYSRKIPGTLVRIIPGTRYGYSSKKSGVDLSRKRILLVQEMQLNWPTTYHGRK